MDIAEAFDSESQYFVGDIVEAVDQRYASTEVRGGSSGTPHGPVNVSSQTHHHRVKEAWVRTSNGAEIKVTGQAIGRIEFRQGHRLEGIRSAKTGTYFYLRNLNTGEVGRHSDLQKMTAGHFGFLGMWALAGLIPVVNIVHILMGLGTVKTRLLDKSPLRRRLMPVLPALLALTGLGLAMFGSWRVGDYGHGLFSLPLVGPVPGDLVLGYTAYLVGAVWFIADLAGKSAAARRALTEWIQARRAETDASLEPA